MRSVPVSLLKRRPNDFFPVLQAYGKEEVTIINPAEFPDKSTVVEYLEPVVLGTIIMPDEYIGKILSLCQVGL